MSPMNRCDNCHKERVLVCTDGLGHEFCSGLCSSEFQAPTMAAIKQAQIDRVFGVSRETSGGNDHADD